MVLLACAAPPGAPADGARLGDSARDGDQDSGSAPADSHVDSQRRPADSGDSAPSAPGDDPLARYDVVVVGAGGAGLAAALTAGELGATVLLVEREAEVGGASVHGGELWAAGTPLQASMGITDSAAQALSEWAEFTRGGDATDPAVVAYCEGAAGTLAWLESHGASFNGVAASSDGGRASRLHIVPMGSATPVAALAAAYSGDLWTSTAVTDLRFDGGAVVGVEVAAGWVEAGAVVVASGGFARNLAWLVEVVPGVAEADWHYETVHGMDGALTRTLEGRVAMQNLEQMGTYVHGVADPNYASGEVMLAPNITGTLVVGASGARAGNEHDTLSLAMRDTWVASGPLWSVHGPAQWATENFATMPFNDRGGGTGSLDPDEYAALAEVYEADDPAVLAGLLGVDAAALADAITRYDAMFDSGRDEDFGKPLVDYQPLAGPPWTAVALVPAAAKSFGGMATLPSGQVLDPAGVPIPGLYGAGEAIGFLGTPAVGGGWAGSVSAVYYGGRVAGAAAAGG